MTFVRDKKKIRVCNYFAIVFCRIEMVIKKSGTVINFICNISYTK